MRTRGTETSSSGYPNGTTRLMGAGREMLPAAAPGPPRRPIPELDPNGNPTHVPEVAPETDEEQQFHEEALMRKQLKLLMAGKASVHQTPELKQQFEAWLSNHEATEGANHQ